MVLLEAGEDEFVAQFVQDMVARMVLGYETSKLLVMQAAWLAKVSAARGANP